jgi:hypothetical protein
MTHIDFWLPLLPHFMTSQGFLGLFSLFGLLSSLAVFAMLVLS